MGQDLVVQELVVMSSAYWGHGDVNLDSQRLSKFGFKVGLQLVGLFGVVHDWCQPLLLGLLLEFVETHMQLFLRNEACGQPLVQDLVHGGRRVVAVICCCPLQCCQLHH